MHKTGLVELEAVVAIARKGSFRMAALDVGMSTSALSHTVKALEARLGVQLFNRTTRSVSLSQAGEQFVAQVAPALADIQGAIEAVNQHRDTPTGTLRINSSVGGARQILKPVVLEFLRRYPHMSVDIVTEARMIDIIIDGFDAGIRRAETVPRDMIAIPVGEVLNFTVVGSPAYFATRPMPVSPDELRDHDCIRTRQPGGAIERWHFERDGQHQSIETSGRLILDEPSLVLEAAREGVGLAYMAHWSVTEDLASGRLQQVLPDWMPRSPGLSFYYPTRRNMTAGLRAFIDLIWEVNRRVG